MSNEYYLLILKQTIVNISPIVITKTTILVNINLEEVMTIILNPYMTQILILVRKLIMILIIKKMIKISVFKKDGNKIIKYEKNIR